MRILNFAQRNLKELIRDPMSVIFCLCLPLFFLIIFKQFNIPNSEYALENFTPGIIIFSFSFVSLFSASLVASDRCTSLLSRLFSSPMKAYEYILGYTLALIPITILQSVLFFVVALFLGLEFSINIIWTILVLIFISFLFIFLGILIGCLTTFKASGACGSLVVQLVAFTSGMWFSIDLAGNFFKGVCEILPFSHALKIARTVLISGESNLFIPTIIVLIYTVLVFIISMVIFKRQMYYEKK